MNLLLLDTSTKNFSVAVASQDRVLVRKNIILEKILSTSIIPSVVKILKKAKLKLREVDGFGVGIGPGSFTSLRVGLATIKGLAFALDKPVVGVSSLDVMAMGCGLTDASVCVVCDARRDLVYACFYRKQNDSLIRQSDYMLVSPQEVVKKITENTILLGDGITIFKKQGFIKKNVIIAQERLWLPDAKNLWPLVKPRFIQEKYDDADKLVPLYLYPEDCQVKK